ncbi:hypothetical protein [Staphylococcus xylosus]|uniref:hypothetical protein n=1 Tax=Staphylococcus xylosus TaxID=1288 RepID=UPI00056ED928|nr:hypothetical protein [Staphylococcus xylosus]
MEVKKYSNLFDFDIQNNMLLYVDPTTKENFSLDITYIKREFICDMSVSDRLLATINESVLIYVKDRKVVIEKQTFSEPIFDITIKNLNKSDINLDIKKGYIVKIKMGNELLFELDNFFEHNIDEKIISKEILKNINANINDRQRYIGLSNIDYNNIKIFITYDRFLKEIKLVNHIHMSILTQCKSRIVNSNNLSIENMVTSKLKKEHIMAYFPLKNKKILIIIN